MEALSVQIINPKAKSLLLNEFSELSDVVPVVRRAETRYKKPVTGVVFSKAKFFETEKNEVVEVLWKKGRVLLKVEVSLFDENEVSIMQSVFEWFVTKL